MCLSGIWGDAANTYMRGKMCLNAVKIHFDRELSFGTSAAV